MRAENTFSITLSPDLLVKAQAMAEKEHRTINELLSDALRRYMQRDPVWDSLIERTRAIGQQMGIRDEDEVERLSDEYRRERQR